MEKTFVIFVFLTLVIMIQEAKESLASPDHLFDGKSNVVKIVDEN